MYSRSLVPLFSVFTVQLMPISNEKLKNMKRFLIQTGLFLLSVALLFAAAYFLTGSHHTPLQNDFMAAMIDKHERAEEIGSPKIVIAGGSNVAFNFDSGKIEEALGLPVVNMGLSVGLGMEFIINETMDIAAEGDIIIFSITFFENIEGLYSLKKHTSRHFPKARRYYRFRLSEELNIHSRKLRENIIALFYSLLGRNVTSIYNRAGFNRFGDFTAHYGLPQVNELGQRFTFESAYWEGIGQLNRLYTDAQKKGYSLYYIYPAYPFSDFERNREALTRLDDDMRRELELPVLGVLEGSLYPETEFFDTAYHLKRESVIHRTEYLIELLRSELNL